MKWSRALLAIVFVVPLLIVLALGFGHDPREVPSLLEDQPAPDFSLRGLDGESLSLASLRGTPVVLNFWSTWCEPCKAEHNLLQQAARYYGGKAKFVGIIYQDEEAKARAYLAVRENRFPQLLDPGSQVAIEYGVAGVPESFIVDSQGVIRHKQTGVITQAVLQSVLTPLAAAVVPGVPATGEETTP